MPYKCYCENCNAPEILVDTEEEAKEAVAYHRENECAEADYEEVEA